QNAKIDDLKTVVEAGKNTIAARDASIATLKGQVSSLTSAIVGLNKTVATQNAKIDDLKTVVEAGKNTIAARDASIATLKGQVSSLTSAKAGVEKERDGLKGQVSSLEQQIAALKAKLNPPVQPPAPAVPAGKLQPNNPATKAAPHPDATKKK
ncbi:MAG: hypothetical protein HY537_12830, partial [Deltaproteobacteria bacterium]|nr:hypothetical protein [Deltaproteobacteria bacterium]